MTEKKQTDKTNTKVLSFERDAGFYYNRYLRSYDDGEFSFALKAIRKASRLDAGNSDYRHSLIELLSEMGLYESSNFEILEITRSGENKLGIRDLLCMGYNFIALGDYRNAHECFGLAADITDSANRDKDGPTLRLLKNGPDEYMPPSEQPDVSAERLFDAAFRSSDDGFDFSDMDSAMVSEDAEFRKLYEMALTALQAHQSECAVSILLEICDHPDAFPAVHNQLAFAYFIMSDYKSSIRFAEGILAVDPYNVRALCSMAVSLYELKRFDECSKYVDRLANTVPNDPGEARLSIAAMFQTRHYEDAFQSCLDLTEVEPYDVEVLHAYAAAASNVCEYEDAIDALIEIMCIDEYDTVSPYYIKRIKAARERNEICEMNMNRDVPQLEFLRRVGKLEATTLLPENIRRTLYQRDEEYKSIMFWAIQNASAEIKTRALCSLRLCMDEEGARRLRRLLLSANMPDDVKYPTVLLLRLYGERLPVLAYMSGHLDDVSETIVPACDKTIHCARTVLELLKTDDGSGEEPTWRDVADEIWWSYVFHTRPTAIRNHRLWAAALEYAARLSVHQWCSQREMAEKYEVSPSSLPETVRKLRRR